MPMRYHSIESLPQAIPIFPLTGVLLLPRSSLPLNIFEPRYLAMVDDAMRGARVIGMIQPTMHENQMQAPPIYPTGTAGYITSYAETDDSRLHIVLKGLCRFRVGEELPVSTPYRQIRAHYDAFRADMTEPDPDEGSDVRERLLATVKGYLSAQRLNADWKAITRAPLESLVNALAMMCPFEAKEKQALLEAPTLTDRADVLITLMAMAAADPQPGSGTRLQ